jgi:hypothetical protein
MRNTSPNIESGSAYKSEIINYMNDGTKIGCQRHVVAQDAIVEQYIEANDLLDVNTLTN